HREVRDPGADCRKGDGLQAVLVRDLEAAPRRPAQAVGGGVATESHAGRMDHMARLQPAAASYRSVADLDRADGPALRLNGRTTRSGDGAGHPTSQLEVVVRGVDDGIDVLDGQIALLDFNRQAIDPPAHAVGWTCHAIAAMRASTSARLIGCNP